MARNMESWAPSLAPTSAPACAAAPGKQAWRETALQRERERERDAKNNHSRSPLLSRSSIPFSHIIRVCAAAGANIGYHGK